MIIHNAVIVEVKDTSKVNTTNKALTFNKRKQRNSEKEVVFSGFIGKTSYVHKFSMFSILYLY